MPPLQQRLIALRVLDVVTVAVWRFGEAYARSRCPDENWKNEDVRDEGTIVAKDNDKWKVDFHDGEPVKAWQRVALTFKSRPTQAERATIVSDDSSDAVSNHGAEEPTVDSSDDDIPAPDHGDDVGAGNVAQGTWTRDDTYGVDERAKHGFMEYAGPRLHDFKASDDGSVDLFLLGQHFLPINFLTEMAKQMQAAKQMQCGGSAGRAHTALARSLVCGKERRWSFRKFIQVNTRSID